MTPEEEKQLEELLPKLPPLSDFVKAVSEETGESPEEVMERIRRNSFTVRPMSYYEDGKK